MNISYLKKQLTDLNFIESKEEKIIDEYFNLIECNKDNKWIKFKTQKHHIIPKCLWKRISSNYKCNDVVNLSHRDHLLAHYYLYKLAGDTDSKLKLGCALSCMCKANNCRNFKSISEEELLRTLNEIDYNLILEDINKLKSNQSKGKIFTEKTRNKLSIARKNYLAGLKENPRKGTHHSEETKQKISKSNKGQKRSLELRKKLSESHKGKIPWNKGLTYKESPEIIEYKKKLKWFTNGVIDTKAITCPEGFYPGRSQVNKDFHKERTKKMKNKIWIHYNKESKMVNYLELDNYINQGWKKGRGKLKGE